MQIVCLRRQFLALVVVAGVCLLEVKASLKFLHTGLFTSNTGTTYPGTKWCGPGNSAQNYTDLGVHSGTDMCCRDHDHCPLIMEANTSFEMLRNPDRFPRLKCSCDAEFYQCLQNVNSIISNKIGYLYFSKRRQCFDEDHPIIGCAKTQGIVHRRCVNYMVDLSQPKRWQFFDNPLYKIPRILGL